MYPKYSLTILVLMRNHEKYVRDCAESIQREFPSEEIGIVVVDAGSSDRSVDKFVDCFINTNKQIEIERRSNESFTLENFIIGVKRISSSHFILLSSDDVFGRNYGKVIEEVLHRDKKHKTLYNVNLEICDESLNLIGFRKSRWSKQIARNRINLSIGNPGNAAGAIFPTSITNKKISEKVIPKTLIEDYWLWWALLEDVNFQNIDNAKVLYRRHPGNVTNMRESKRYARSLGSSAAIPLTNSNPLIFKFISLFLVVKWMRHIKLRLWPSFLQAYFSGIHTKLKIN